MKAADFTESILKEILRKHVLVSISSNLVVFWNIMLQIYFPMHNSNFYQIPWKISAEEALFFNKGFM